MLFHFKRKPYRAGLEWGVRESLTAYVTQLPDGVVAVTGAADFVSGAHPPRFRFPEVSRTERQVRFAGAVQIVGHRGMLRVAASDPWLTLDRGVAALSIKTEQNAARITVAEVTIADLAWADEAPAVLTTDGAMWLGPNYSPGDAASTVSLSPIIPSARNKKSG